MYLFLDTETTGLPKNWNAPESDLKNWPRIVQIAWLQYDNKENLISKHSYIIKPDGFTIPPDSIKFHGVSTELAKKEGVVLNEVLKKFSLAVDASKILICHNVDFDKKIVGAELLRTKIVTNLHKLKPICTMEQSKEFCKIPWSLGGYKKPTLLELHTKLFGVQFKDSHDALRDVEACAKCFFELKQRKVIKL